MQKVAIVGAGRMGEVHKNAYLKMSNVRIAAVMSSSLDVAEILAASIGAQVFSDFDDMLQVVQPDVVDICTPTDSHKEYVLKSAAAGKHIVIEKPMACTLEDCREMIEATNRAGVKFMVAQVLRFFPQFAMAKTLVDSGAVGNPAVVRIARGGAAPKNWRVYNELRGGVIFDFMIHDFDWLLWTFGEPERVYAKSLTGQGVKDIDYALVTIRFKSGVIAHAAGNWAHDTADSVQELEIAGDAGLIDLAKQSSIIMNSGNTLHESPTGVDPYYAELKHFIDCVETGKDPSVTPEQSMQAVAVALGAQESIRTGKPFDLRQV